MADILHMLILTTAETLAYNVGYAEKPASYGDN